MDRLNSMRIFSRVAELGSFTRAAEELGLPKASVSNAVQQLENHLGSRLLQRTTRKVVMTQDGRIFYERCKDLLADMEEIESMFQRTTATIGGRLRVDLPTALARNLVVPRLPEFLDAYPGIALELSGSDRRVDVVREGFDCVVRVGTLDDSAIIARPLGRMRVINCVSPGYIRRYGEPRTLDDLKDHWLVHYAPTLGARADGWEYRDGERYVNVDMPGRITVNNADAYTCACLAGLGIIQVPAPGMRRYLASGELVEVLKDFQAEPMPVSLLYPHRRNLSRRVQVFMDWLADIMREYLA